MHVETTWRKRAIEHFNALSPARTSSASHHLPPRLDTQAPHSESYGSRNDG